MMNRSIARVIFLSLLVISLLSLGLLHYNDTLPILLPHVWQVDVTRIEALSTVLENTFKPG